MNRRHFLMGTAIIAGNAVVRGVQSPNDTVRVGIAGLGGRGSAHVSAWAAMKNVQIAGLCDVDETHVGEKMNALEAKGVSRPTVYTDFRQMLESKDIDAVSIATPNHWHTLQTIWACQAGKDVYVEKPCSHNVFESQQIVAAARKYNRMVQQGSQNRSNPALREAVERMRSGEIGELYMARGLCYKWRDTIGKTPVEPVPPGVDYDLWLGPAPKRPFTKNRFHYNWHWFWDTGNGDIGNQGIHEIDKARWGLGVTHPAKVTAIGGKFMFDDDQETPNTISAAYEFDVDGKKRMMTFEVRHWISPHEAGIAEGTPGNTVGNQYYGSKGYLVMDGDRYYSYLGKDHQPGPSARGREEHFANFLDAVRSRKRESLNCEIEEGALSCNLVHLANISYRLGRTVHWDPKKMECVGDAEANRMLTRDYRKPFVVPERV